MEVKEIRAKLGEAALASGLDRGTLRKWTNNPTKGKTACGLVRGGVLTLEQYSELKNSSIAYYNNMLLSFINIKFSITIDGLAELLSVTRKTVSSLAEDKASATTKKALFYICSNKLGIQNPEELFYASNNKAG